MESYLKSREITWKKRLTSAEIHETMLGEAGETVAER